jgi:hypothetical protein
MKNALAARPEHHENGRGGTRTRDLTDVNLLFTLVENG